MEYVSPIKEIVKINEIKRNLQKQSLRDLLLFVFGINTGIRAHELLSLKIEDVWDGEVKEFIELYDTRTEEQKVHYLNHNIKQALLTYLGSIEFKQSDYLFRSKKQDLPITRQQAYRIINRAAREVGITGKVGMHTLRKTFGYHAYCKGIAISILMDIFNHQTHAETLRYIGIEKDQEQYIKVDVNL